MLFITFTQRISKFFDSYSPLRNADKFVRQGVHFLLRHVEHPIANEARK